MNSHCLAKSQMSPSATEETLQDARHGWGHRSTAQGLLPLSSHPSLLSSAPEEAGGASDWEPGLRATAPMCYMENESRAKEM